MGTLCPADDATRKNKQLPDLLPDFLKGKYEMKAFWVVASGDLEILFQFPWL